MNDLVAFLTARLDEDEERARFVAAQIEHMGGVSEPWRLSWHDEYDLLCIEPSRALREVEAKRAIVKVAAEADAKCPEDDWPADGDMSWAGLSDMGRYNLRALAAAYADHPSYRDEWRPT